MPVTVRLFDWVPPRTAGSRVATSGRGAAAGTPKKACKERWRRADGPTPPLGAQLEIRP